MAGALALAGITASLVFRFGRTQRRSAEIRGDRRAIWDSVHTERSVAIDVPGRGHADLAAQCSARDPARDPRAPDDPERRVTEMLARLARSAQT